MATGYTTAVHVGHDVSMGRERLFTVRMSDEERERAELVARHYGLNVAGVLRMLLKREADTIGAKATETSKTRGKRTR